jgi:hypothetical protein
MCQLQYCLYDHEFIMEAIRCEHYSVPLSWPIRNKTPLQIISKLPGSRKDYSILQRDPFQNHNQSTENLCDVSGFSHLSLWVF